MSNFLGSHAINMDAKGRLAIPTKVREELAQLCGGRIVLTANADEEKCLLLYPEPEWEVLRPKIRALPNRTNAAMRPQRPILGNAALMGLDAPGRLQFHAGSVTKHQTLQALGRFIQAPAASDSW